MNIHVRNKDYQVKDPNICPHCHVVNKPTLYNAYNSSTDDNKFEVISTWQCSNDSCCKIFVAIFKEIQDGFQFDRFLNGLPKGPEWPKPILDLEIPDKENQDEFLKSKFIKTYLQSLQAEHYGLDELAGMGYRKSIEYLVKDWAIQNHPDKKEIIEQQWLGQVIKDYFTGDLKDILERATWLGNDQSHYLKLFEDFDIAMLKELIDLIMVELDRDYKKKHYIELIKRKNKTEAKT